MMRGMKKYALFFALTLILLVLWFLSSKTIPLPSLYFIQIPDCRNENKLSDKLSSSVHFTSQKQETGEKTPSNILPLHVIEFARRLNQKGRILILAAFNDGQLLMAHSWLCNTFYMGIHQQVLLVVPDTKSRDHLRCHWPGVQVEALYGSGVSSGSQDFGEIGYVRLTLWRNVILHEFLKANVELLLCEMDALWIRNPVPETRRLAEGYDMAAIFVNKEEVGFGYMYIKPSTKVLLLWQKFTERFTANVSSLGNIQNPRHKVDYSIMDQRFLTALLKENYAGVRTKILSNKQFLDGLWYDSLNETLFRNAFILNNNVVIGNLVKVNRARKYQHWFLKNRYELCDFELVNKTVLK